MFVIPARGLTFVTASNIPSERPSGGLVFGWVVFAVVVSRSPMTRTDRVVGSRRQRKREPTDLA